MQLKRLLLLAGFLAIMNILPAQGFSGIRPFVFNVTEYGAKGDGKTLDSPAINKTIEAAVAAGGGTVFLPAGTFVSGTIRLKSNITLFLGQGCVLEASSDSTVYDKPEPNVWGDKFEYQDFGHSHWHNSLIWGDSLVNVSILGPGLIYGKGLTRSLHRDKMPIGVGNKSIALKHCHNVILRDFSILKGGHFGMLLTGVDNLTIDNLKLDTNRDGMDIDCCRNVRVSNCTVNSPWDDGICLKSCYGLGYSRSTDNVTITNCYVTAAYELGSVIDGTFRHIGPGYQSNGTGRIKLGTESNGGFRNITISNCVFEGCQGLALESVDGSLLEDVSISNITMRDIINAPLFLRLGTRMRGPKGTAVGTLRRINISNIVAYNVSSKTGCIISGVPGYNIEDVKISNVQLFYKGGGSADMASFDPPEKEDAYPEPGMFGTMPAYGFSIRHVKGIELNNIDITCEKDDARPVFWLYDVKGVDFRNVKASKSEARTMLKLKNVSNFNTSGVKLVPDMHIDNVELKDI